MTNPNTSNPPVFSRMFRVDHLREGGSPISIEANAQERAALAHLNGLQAITSLEGKFLVLRDGRTGARVKGEMRATISLERFESEIFETVDVHFAPQNQSENTRSKSQLDALQLRDLNAAIDLDLDSPEPPDPIINGQIDLGALVAEFLVLSLDPHPRKPDVSFVDILEHPDCDLPNTSPFAILKKGG
jgi:hypothetical protein